MELTRKQQEGLLRAVEKYNNGDPYVCISGYAGSGKSTLIRFIISALDVDPNTEVAYVAFTGKAANVLKNKGCPNPTTAHRLMYKAKLMPNGKFAYFPKDIIEEYKVIVVDEISMLPLRMWQQLLKYKIFIIACGDPGQLPPVTEGDNNHVLERPDIFLDEIMRQAQDSEIIRLSMDIREGKSLNLFNGKEVRILDRKDVVDGMFDWADQILCATNKERNSLNNKIRMFHNRGPEPENGDKVIALHNDWDMMTLEGTPLTNGQIGTLIMPDKRELVLPYYVADFPVPIIRAKFQTEEDEYFECLDMDYNLFKTGEKTLTGRQEYALMRNKNTQHLVPYEFTYAYAITVWKAQGSEWNKVLLFEENFPHDKIDHKKYLYTGITRASEKIVIIRKD